MRQPVPEMVGKRRRKHLRLVFQAAKRARVHNPIPIPLKIVAVRMCEFRITAAPGALQRKAQMR
jgi:hypothetical protein